MGRPWQERQAEACGGLEWQGVQVASPSATRRPCSWRQEEV